MSAVMIAEWNGVQIAASANAVIVEGNHYFPADAVDPACLRPSDTTTVCGWKGTANYHSVVVDGQVNVDAAWYYADPKPAAEQVRGRIAFWRGVIVRPAAATPPLSD